MSHEGEQVRKFYDVIWSNHDKSAIPGVLHESFYFRGSLGLAKKGHNGFVEYLDTVGNVWEWKCSKYESQYTGEEQHFFDKNLTTVKRIVRGGS